MKPHRMTQHHRLLVQLGLLAFIVLLPVSISACSCSPQLGTESVRERVVHERDGYDAVFVGRVMERIVPEVSLYVLQFRIRVESAWKGVNVNEVLISTGREGYICGYGFEVGASYLIYAKGTPKIGFQTNRCTRTAPVGALPDDRQYLGEPNYRNAVLDEQPANAPFPGNTMESVRPPDAKIVTSTDTCSCYSLAPATASESEKIRYALAHSPSVFSGKVIEIKTVPSGVFAGVLEVTFAVELDWKNARGGKVKILTDRYAVSDSPPFSMTCGFRFSVGESYLVYAEREVGKNLLTSICSRTRKLVDAEEDERVLRTLRGGN